ncbi:MAG: hypothetical protein IAF58_09175 [Leptolyngbya sp.]|nr:hypothetical protein [Candidatus Melainabacteria bacterium]
MEVLSQEEANNLAWDKIKWLTEPAEAAEAAEREHKPIIVYFFLKGTTGPAAAPC